MSIRVFVVDDTDDIRLLLGHLLGTAGFEVVGFPGGSEALEQLACDDRLPDLVVLDVQMPELDGWETLERIRANASTSHLRVLMCTVKGSAIDLIRGWELGCDGYVSKPFDLSTLRDEIRAVIERPEAERARVRELQLESARRQQAHL